MAYTFQTSYQPGAVEGYTIDPVTGRRVPSSTLTAMSPMSTADMKLANKALGKELAVNAGIAGIGQLAQLGASFIPTAQDARNKEKLAELQQLEETGQLGLSASERQQLEAETMNPVKALARESRLRSEAAQASMGEGTSAADVTRAAREERRDVQAAAQNAGIAIGRANLEKAAEQVSELESRIAYKSNRAADRIKQGEAIVGGMAPLVGRAAAAQASVREPSVAELKKAYPELAGLEDDAILTWYRAASSKAQNDAFQRLASGYVGGQ